MHSLCALRVIFFMTAAFCTTVVCSLDDPKSAYLIMFISTKGLKVHFNFRSGYTSKSTDLFLSLEMPTGQLIIFLMFFLMPGFLRERINIFSMQCHLYFLS